MSELKKIYLCVPFDDKEYAKKMDVNGMLK